MTAHQPFDRLDLVTRREAIQRVTVLLGGVALVGGDALLTGRRRDPHPQAQPLFTAQEVAFLEEVAETMLPETDTPGAKAAQTGAFMALMVQDSYQPSDQRIFRDGLRAIDDATRAAHGVGFMQASATQRLAVLRVIDAEQKEHSDARAAARRARSLAYLRDQPAAPAAPAPAAAGEVTADTPTHYFRMMKELALL
ncbi:MAG TPA: gluconate 2-dehydrogenase subunit 3 family protein, partial [Gemmatimonadales bacterium]|nr:gluconate 2-dehydrogenase subunit 3 family protein [Gemmatimonadales bacterium]